MLILIYSNAAAILPQSFTYPNQVFLVVSLISGISLCMIAFVGCLLVAKVGSKFQEAFQRQELVKPKYLQENYKFSNQSRQKTLVFNIGMNNNGVGLVLASTVCPQYPQIMLPIISYNLAQKPLASLIARSVNKSHFPKQLTT